MLGTSELSDRDTKPSRGGCSAQTVAENQAPLVRLFAYLLGSCYLLPHAYVFAISFEIPHEPSAQLRLVSRRDSGTGSHDLLLFDPHQCGQIR